MSVTALPEQLSDPAREFAGRTHELLIDGERVAGRRRADVRDARPGHRPADHDASPRPAPTMSTAPSRPRARRFEEGRGEAQPRPSGRG